MTGPAAPLLGPPAAPAHTHQQPSGARPPAGGREAGEAEAVSISGKGWLGGAQNVGEVGAGGGGGQNV